MSAGRGGGWGRRRARARWELFGLARRPLQRTSTGEGLLINGDLPPVFFRQRRHYLDRGLRQLKGELTN